MLLGSGYHPDRGAHTLGLARRSAALREALADHEHAAGSSAGPQADRRDSPCGCFARLATRAEVATAAGSERGPQLRVGGKASTTAEESATAWMTPGGWSAAGVRATSGRAGRPSSAAATGARRQRYAMLLQACAKCGWIESGATTGGAGRGRATGARAACGNRAARCECRNDESHSPSGNWAASLGSRLRARRPASPVQVHWRSIGLEDG